MPVSPFLGVAQKGRNSLTCLRARKQPKLNYLKKGFQCETTCLPSRPALCLAIQSSLFSDIFFSLPNPYCLNSALGFFT